MYSFHIYDIWAYTYLYIWHSQIASRNVLQYLKNTIEYDENDQIYWQKTLQLGNKKSLYWGWKIPDLEYSRYIYSDSDFSNMWFLPDRNVDDLEDFGMAIASLVSSGDAVELLAQFRPTGRILDN